MVYPQSLWKLYYVQKQEVRWLLQGSSYRLGIPSDCQLVPQILPEGSCHLNLTHASTLIGPSALLWWSLSLYHKGFHTWGGVLGPFQWAFCPGEQRWSSSWQGPHHLDQTLVRLVWTFFWTKPCPWPADPSLVRIPLPLISNQVPLSDFLTTDSLTLPTGYKSPAVFTVFRVELTSTLKSLSSTAIAQIKSVLPF